jgi:hypothetical protein
VLDILSKLYAHGHGLAGYCRACRRWFGVPMPALVAARRADSPRRPDAAAQVRWLRRPEDGDPRHGAEQGRQLVGAYRGWPVFRICLISCDDLNPLVQPLRLSEPSEAVRCVFGDL